MFTDYKAQRILVTIWNIVKDVPQSLYPGLTPFGQINAPAFSSVSGVLMPGAAWSVEGQIIYGALGIIACNPAYTVSHQDSTSVNTISENALRHISGIDGAGRIDVAIGTITRAGPLAAFGVGAGLAGVHQIAPLIYQTISGMGWRAVNALSYCRVMMTQQMARPEMVAEEKSGNQVGVVIAGGPLAVRADSLKSSIQRMG